MIYFDDKKTEYEKKPNFTNFTFRRGGGGALQLHLYGGVWPQDWKIDPSTD